LLHKENKYFAVIYENTNQGLWVDIGKHIKRCKVKLKPITWGRKYFIATQAAHEDEWPNEHKEIIRKPDATPAELLQLVTDLGDGLAIDNFEPDMFWSYHHDFMWSKWLFLDKSNDPKIIQAGIDDKDERFAKWVADFVKFFRPLGFIKAPKSWPNKKLAQMIMDYDEPLFEHFPGTHAVVDDYDSIKDFFSLSEQESLPQSTQFLDLKILAALDRDRVWWAFRLWAFEKETDGGSIDCVGLIKSLGDISSGHFAPKDIIESEVRGGQSEITLSLDGNTHQLKNKYVKGLIFPDDDAELTFPDMEILTEINKITHEGIGKYHYFEFDGGDEEEEGFWLKFILLLNEADRNSLEKKRGWKF
jgi:hypothetical protein